MDDDDCIKTIKNEIGDLIEEFGLPKTIGEVWATLYFKKDMTQQELKKELGCSLSTISQSITILEKLGSIEATSKSGRKKIYSAQDSITKNVKKRLEKIDNNSIKPMIKLLEEKEKQLKDKELKTKVKNLNEKYRNFSKMLNLISKTP